MSSTLQNATEATASAVATKSTYAGSVATIGGYFLQSEFIAFCGLMLALLGFVVNLIFKIREDKRQQEVHRIALDNAAKAAATNERLEEVTNVLKSNRAHAEGYGGYPHPLQRERAPDPQPVEEEGTK